MNVWASLFLDAMQRDKPGPNEADDAGPARRRHQHHLPPVLKPACGLANV